MIITTSPKAVCLNSKGIVIVDVRIETISSRPLVLQGMWKFEGDMDDFRFVGEFHGPNAAYELHQSIDSDARAEIDRAERRVANGFADIRLNHIIHIESGAFI